MLLRSVRIDHAKKEIFHIILSIVAIAFPGSCRTLDLPEDGASVRMVIQLNDSKDVLDLAGVFGKMGSLYGRVHTNIFLNEKVTTESIRSSKELLNKAKAEDTVDRDNLYIKVQLPWVK